LKWLKGLSKNKTCFIFGPLVCEEQTLEKRFLVGVRKKVEMKNVETGKFLIFDCNLENGTAFSTLL
jgi:hypothetical protein